MHTVSAVLRRALPVILAIFSFALAFFMVSPNGVFPGGFPGGVHGGVRSVHVVTVPSPLEREECGLTIQPAKDRNFPMPQYTPQEYADLVARMQAIPPEPRTPQSVTAWQCMGPYGVSQGNNTIYSGRVLDISAGNSGQYTLVASAMGGLWTYQLAGLFAVPVPLTDNLGILSIGSVARNPVDSNLILVGTGAPYDNMGLGLSQGTGMYESTDGGTTWRYNFTGYGEGFYRIRYSPHNARLVHATTNAGYYRSVNGGDYFGRVRNGNFCALAINALHPDTLYLGQVGGALYRSIDSGRTWQGMATTGFPGANVGRWSLALCDNAPNVMYAFVAMADSGRTLGIFKSTDGGTEWTDVSWRNAGGTIIDTYWGQGWYNNVMSVCPTNPDIVLAGGGSILRTTNGGTTWTEFGGDQKVHPDQHAMTWSPDGQNVWIGNDGGIAFSNDQGATWNVGANTLPITQTLTMDVSSAQPNVIITGTQDNANPLTTNGGATWRWTGGGDGQGVAAAIDGNHLYEAFNNQLFRSTNHGTTWDWSVNGLDTPWTYVGLCQDRYTVQRAFAFTGKYTYKTENGGTSWSRMNETPWAGFSRNITAAAGNPAGDILLYDALYLLSSASDKIKRYDNGVWSEASNGMWSSTDIYRVCTHPRNRDIAYAILEMNSSGYYLYKTTDRGDNWTHDISRNIPYRAPITCLVPHPTNDRIVYIGTAGFGCFKTANGGASWSQWNNGLPAGLNVAQMSFIDSTDINGKFYIVISTNGRGVWMRDISGNDPLPVAANVNIPLRSLVSLPHASGVVAVSDSGRFGRTIDSGRTWSVTQLPTSNNLYAVCSIESLIHLAVGQAGSMLRTTDDGKNWTVLSQATKNDLRASFFIDNLNGVAGGDGGTILRTSDGGKTWQKAADGNPWSIRSFAFTDQGNGWAGGTDLSGLNPSQLLLRTTDGGNSWFNTNVSLGDGSVHALSFPTPLIGYAAAGCKSCASALWKTTDGGAKWDPMPNVPAGSWNACAFIDANIGWIGGDGGMLLNTTDGGATWWPEQTNNTGVLSSLLWTNGVLMAAGDSGCVSTPTPEYQPVSVTFSAGWNMVSLPLDGSAQAVKDFLPAATSSAFSYTTGYVSNDSLHGGRGYWVKLGAAGKGSHFGVAKLVDNIAVNAQWNMIGSISTPVAAASITTIPDGVLAGTVYGYNHGYYPADTIEPGQAYWVKCSQAGTITLDATGGNAAPKPAGLVFKDCDAMEFSADSHRPAKLYISAAPLTEEQQRAVEMPPPPPAGAFDVRFANNRIVAAGDAAGKTELPVLVQSSVYPVMVHWRPIPSARGASLLIDGKEFSLAGEGSAAIVSPASHVALRLGTSAPAIPKSFALYQNYPNPFNPSTEIRFDLPVAAHVTLQVYDVAGHKVATVVDEQRNAGEQRVQFRTDNLASGVYLYRITAGSFTQVRKMVLVK